jgi:hypothetical protein
MIRILLTHRFDLAKQGLPPWAITILSAEYGLCDSFSGDDKRHCFANLCSSLPGFELLSDEQRGAIRSAVKKELEI